MARIKGKSK